MITRPGIHCFYALPFKVIVFFMDLLRRPPPLCPLLRQQRRHRGRRVVLQIKPIINSCCDQSRMRKSTESPGYKSGAIHNAAPPSILLPLRCLFCNEVELYCIYSYIFTFKLLLGIQALTWCASISLSCEILRHAHRCITSWQSTSARRLLPPYL